MAAPVSTRRKSLFHLLHFAEHTESVENSGEHDEPGNSFRIHMRMVDALNLARRPFARSPWFGVRHSIIGICAAVAAFATVHPRSGCPANRNPLEAYRRTDAIAEAG